MNGQRLGLGQGRALWAARTLGRTRLELNWFGKTVPGRAAPQRETWKPPGSDDTDKGNKGEKAKAKAEQQGRPQSAKAKAKRQRLSEEDQSYDLMSINSAE